MRRKSVAAIILSCAMLCGCTFGGKQSGPINSNHGGNDDKPVVEEPSEVETPDLPDIGGIDDLPVFEGFGNDNAEFYLSPEEQIDLMMKEEEKEKWYYSGDLDEGYSVYYAVTDLDENSRLEIISVFTGFSNFSTFTMFEVNVTGETLERVSNSIEDGDSMPDLSWGDLYKFARDSEGNLIGYIVNDGYFDEDRNVAGGMKYIMSMKDGKIDYQLISSNETIYGSDGSTVTFLDENGNPIDGWEEYDAYTDKFIAKYYPGAETKYKSMNFVFDPENDENLRDVLVQSWECVGEWDSIDAYYSTIYDYGAGTDFINDNGSLSERECGKEDVLNTQWAAFESYIYETDNYYDYQSDTSGYFSETWLKIDKNGVVTFHESAFECAGDIEFPTQKSSYANVDLKWDTYNMNTSLHFYTFVSDAYGELEVIALEFGEELIYFWPAG